MSKLRVGIIGLGVGKAHIEGYHAHQGCVVTSVCDFSAPKRSEIQEKYPDLKVTEKAEEILNDSEIDIISIASYDNYHYEHAAIGLQNGKHIFVEKPLCLYRKDAGHLRSLLRKRPDLKMSSNLILRQSPRFCRLKQMIRSGEFGELFYVEGDYHYGRIEKLTDGWRGQIDFYSVVYGGSVHLIDLLLWLTDDLVEEVAAYGNQIVSKGSQFRYNDCVVAILKFKSGIIGKVTADFGGVRPHFHNLCLYGTKATFLNDVPHGKLFRSRDPASSPENITDAYPEIRKGDLIRGFVDSILNGSEPEVSLEDVFKAMSVCFAIEEATKRNGTSVRVQSV